LKNVDRSTAHHMVVTVGEVTVIITDYKLKASAEPSTDLDSSMLEDKLMCLYSTDSDSN